MSSIITVGEDIIELEDEVIWLGDHLKWQTETSLLLTSFLEAAALCNGVNHTWSLAFTVAPGRQKRQKFFLFFKGSRGCWRWKEECSCTIYITHSFFTHNQVSLMHAAHSPDSMRRSIIWTSPTQAAAWSGVRRSWSCGINMRSIKRRRRRGGEKHDV